MESTRKRNACPRPVHILLAALAGLPLWPAPASAQKPPAAVTAPQLLIVTPAGARAGTSVEVTLAGQNLDEPERLVFSNADIEAELIPEPPPPPPDPKKPKPPNAAPPPHRFKVTVPAETPVGTYDVRVVARDGVSNPRSFVVGDLDEVLEKEPNNDVNEAQRVPLNTTVTGAITATTDVDYFVFAGKEGQRVVLSCLTTSIDSRLEAAIEVYDAHNRQIAFNRNYRLGDALADCTLPADGDYTVRLYGFTYTSGDPEHFYRLSISTAPWIDAVFPPVVAPGKRAQLTVYGRNLPGGKPDPSAVVDGRALERVTVTMDVPEAPQALHRLAYRGHVAPPASGLDGFEYRLHNDAGTSNPFLLTYARAAVVEDAGDNDTAETAQEVSVPCEIAGRIEKKRDRDWYSFEAKKGEVYSIEAYADRLGAPVDLYLVLRDATGKRVLAELDDNPEVLSQTQFLSRSEDPPRFRFVAPADGRYRLMVSSREAYVQAGPRDYYRVRIAPEEPDFRLVVMPQSPNTPDACLLHPGSRQYFTAFVWRLDGWAGEVTLTAEGLPPGVTCPAQTIGPGLRQGTLVVSAGADAEAWTGPITVKGTATVDDREVVREARPAGITWAVPQNITALSRLERRLWLAVRPGKPPFTVDANRETITLAPGEKAGIDAKVERLWADFKGPVQVTVVNLPQNLTANNNQPLAVAPGRKEATLLLNANQNVAPGDYQVVLRGQAQLQVPKDATSKQKVNVIAAQVSAPITISIRPKQLARLSLDGNRVRVKPGDEKEVTVRLSRMYDFQGPFKVEFVVSGKAADLLSAEEVTVPAGKSEAKLVLKVADDAKPGTASELVVRATAKFKDVAVTQETRLNVDVVKK